MADDDIEKAADLAALDGTARGPLTWDDVFLRELDDPGPLADADDLDELEVTD